MLQIDVPMLRERLALILFACFGCLLPCFGRIPPPSRMQSRSSTTAAARNQRRSGSEIKSHRNSIRASGELARRSDGRLGGFSWQQIRSYTPHVHFEGRSDRDERSSSAAQSAENRSSHEPRRPHSMSTWSSGGGLVVLVNMAWKCRRMGRGSLMGPQHLWIHLHLDGARADCCRWQAAVYTGVWRASTFDSTRNGVACHENGKQVGWPQR